MTPEEKALLQRTFELSQENNLILRKMRKSALITSAFQILYWVLILGLTFGAFYFIQPYLTSIMGTFGTPEAGNQSSSVGGFSQMLDALKQLKQ